MKIATQICLSLAGLAALAVTPAFAQRIAIYDTVAAKAQFSRLSFAYQDVDYQRRNLARLDAELSAQVNFPGSTAIAEKWAPAFALLGIDVSGSSTWDQRSWLPVRGKARERFQEQIGLLAAKALRVADANSSDWPAQEYSSIIRRSIATTGFDQVLDKNSTPSNAGYLDVTGWVMTAIGTFAGKGYVRCFTPDGYKAWTETKARYPGKVFPDSGYDCQPGH